MNTTTEQKSRSFSEALSCVQLDVDWKYVSKSEVCVYPPRTRGFSATCWLLLGETTRGPISLFMKLRAPTGNPADWEAFVVNGALSPIVSFEDGATARSPQWFVVWPVGPLNEKALLSIKTKGAPLLPLRGVLPLLKSKVVQVVKPKIHFFLPPPLPHAFTGQLGTPNSLIGNIQPGYIPGQFAAEASIETYSFVSATLTPMRVPLPLPPKIAPPPPLRIVPSVALASHNAIKKPATGY